MAQKVKISVRKILQAVFTLVVAACCIVAMVSASKIENQKFLDKVEVNIQSEKLYHFVEEKQILDEAIYSRNIDIMNIPIGKLDIQSMEQVLKTDPWVADAQLYVDNNRVLHIFITQRIPVARIFDRSGNSYYIDKTLNEMPLSDSFKYYTSVVTNAPFIGTDSLGNWIKSQVVALVQTIRADTFWNAQVSQIIIDSDFTFQLIPVLGQQKIIFGDTSRMKEKLSNIYSFYKNVLNRIGWDKYETLNVRFKGQVIASPSLPYTGPVDKAVTEMDWRHSIEQTEARKDSVIAAAQAKTNGDSKKEPVKKDQKGKEKPSDHKPAKPVAIAKNDIKSGHDSKPQNSKAKDSGKNEKNTKKNTDKKPAKSIYSGNNN